MEMIRLAAHLLLLLGAVNTGALTSGDKVLLFDCCDTVTPARLEQLGIKHVEYILCTQHKRTNTAGAYQFVGANGGSPKIVVPADERDLFDKTNDYWKEWKNRWHLYHSQPGPEVLVSPLPVYRAVREGDIIEWEGFKIRVLDTPGATLGGVSYLIEIDDKTFCFSGDAIYTPGKVWDLYSLQKRSDFGSSDYHGFMGNLRQLKPTLEKLASCGASVLVPLHGKVIENPAEATRLTLERLDKAYQNYCSISSIRYYFPKAMTEGMDNPDRMPFARTLPKIDFIQQIPGSTTFIIKSESGTAFVIDCGYDRVVDELRKQMRNGEIKTIEGCWITHFHDDHTDGLGRLYSAFKCPIMTDEHMAEIIEHPERFFIPCISPNIAPVTKATKNGEKWTWREFTLTAYHFPGQTYYHSGLLVEGRGKRIFFGGDSFSPAGVDDYCAGNRNFLGEGRGFNLCLDLIKELKPDGIINPHQELAVKFTDDEIDYMKKVLTEREKIFAELIPWEHPNFGTDVWWVRTYPYQQDVFSGATFTVAVQFTNHANLSINANIEPVLPDGWIWHQSGVASSAILPLQDAAIRSTISVPENTRPGQYVIPFRITWNGRYLGQIRHAVVYVMYDKLLIVELLKDI